MADLTGSRVVVDCNNSCGCPRPSPGSAACRCAAAGGEHQQKCLSGNNCGFKPCACGPPVAATVNERFYCRCGPRCTCSTTCGA
ncbi:hypothetical protein NL676_039677 [Syzygium grande]|nr:hypothetical protein NL676_039677 [Syzygium grande]